MQSDIIRTDDVTTVALDGKCDGLVTGIGFTGPIAKVVMWDGETACRGNTLYMHVGSPSKVSIKELTFNTTTVTALTYADVGSGLERAGYDPSGGDGRISVVLILDADVPDSTLARAGITVTEGITAALQDLRAMYNALQASGSAVQEIAVIRDNDSSLFLRGAGKHTKLGELIGRSVVESVKESAGLNGINLTGRMSVMSMMASCGYDQERLFRISGGPDLGQFLSKAVVRDSDPMAIAAVASVIRICDAVSWGLMSESEGRKVASEVLRGCIREPSGPENTLGMLATTVSLFLAGL